MDLWIRSQNKLELLLTKNISICCNNSKWKIVTAEENAKDNIGENLLLLGEYSSKERCIEILDDIYNQMRFSNCCDEYYEMPKE